MPKFLYSVLLFSGFLWWLSYFWIRQHRPDSLSSILTFLLIIFFAFGMTLSVPFYFYFYKKVPAMTKLRQVYRRGIKWSFFLSAGITFALALKAFNLLNLINAGLFIVLYYGLYLQLRSKR